MPVPPETESLPRTPYPRQATPSRVIIRCGKGAKETELGPLFDKATPALGAAEAREGYVFKRKWELLHVV